MFGIGLARTGTTSLHRAMLELGLRSAPDSVALLDQIDVAFLGRYDAFFDNPVPFRYRQLERVCSDSLWIVTQRPRQDWLRSMRWLFGPGLDRLGRKTRKLGDRVHHNVYGRTTFDADALGAVYDQHYGDVADWIDDKPAVWLQTADLAWEPICDLLGVAVPDVAFPHENSGRPNAST